MDDDRPAYRRFNLGDAMIVVAAAAVASALGRAHILPNLRSALWPVAIGISGNPPGGQTITMPLPFDPLGFALAVNASVVELLAVSFLAFALMRLRRPRPPLRIVALQPGMVAFWAVAASVGLAFLASLGNGGLAGLLVVMAAADLALPVCWLALKSNRLWRPEPSWIDHFGRVLGVCWCAATWVSTGLILTAIARS